jgi:5'-3' exonuclease
MRVHLVDGTYELFRHFFAVPRHRVGGREVGAARGVMRSLVGMLEGGATHVGVATDHVIESFRNGLFPGYKTGSGIEPELREQFEPLERAIAAAGIPVWAMVEFEADDALASAAAIAASDGRVEVVMIATPDKDLAQCVVGSRVVQHDRRTGLIRTAEGVRERFGVEPQSIPDYLALVGDAADGVPGLPGWGPRSAATLLAEYRRIEDIPASEADWTVTVRSAARLAGTLRDRRHDADLFKRLTTLRTDAPTLRDGVDELRWRGPGPDFHAVCAELGADDVPERIAALIRAG